MKIKRKFSYLGAARAFRVLINGEKVGSVKILKTEEFEVPTSGFSLQLETMKFEKSKVFKMPARNDLYVEANLNPLLRLMYAGLVIFFFGVIVFGLLSTEYAAGVFLASIAVLVLHYTVFVKNYITIKVFDNEHNPIDIESV